MSSGNGRCPKANKVIQFMEYIHELTKFFVFMFNLKTSQNTYKYYERPEQSKFKEQLIGPHQANLVLIAYAEQRRFRRACASAQSRQNLRCSLIQAVSQEEPSDRQPDPWPL